MRYLLITIIAVFLFYKQASSQALRPANKSKIYYTQIMFEYPSIDGKAYYKIEVSDEGANAFSNKKIYHAIDSSSAHLASKIFGFGKTYYWRYLAYNKNNKVIFTSPVFSFSTLSNYLVNPKMFKTNIVWHKPEECLPGIISGDNNFLYTRNGEPVFFLIGVNTLCRDFKINYDGNITILDTTELFETNLNNQKLWRSPHIKTPDYEIKMYHHGVIKLPNGNFLCMAKKFNKTAPSSTPINAIIELNYKNELVWSWFEDDYYPNDSNLFKGSHLNSIFVDKENFLYTSNRDLNSIIKIDRSSGKIVYAIGYDMGNGIPFVSNNYFAGQHHVTKLENGNLLMLNNGLGAAPILNSSILEIEEPDGQEALNPVWNYEFNFEPPVFNHVARMGGVTKLPNGNYLVGMGVFNKIFEVNQSQELVWESNYTRKDTIANQFNPVPVYRAHYMSSLYPSYFTCEINKATKTISITNEGTEADTYQIEVFNSKKQKKKSVQTEIKRESAAQIQIPELSTADSIYITPLSNAKRKRSLLF
ncbi:MAG: aryl-sulfate sulfotransferase [Bacteroidota bacterium]|nr:aryl-sulfate sulfotransferase [Bacteroidota bacterium]